MSFFNLTSLFLYSISFILTLIVLRVVLHRTALIFVFKKWFHWIEDKVHVHQFFKVPQFNENSQHNQFYGKLSTYLNSLGSIEDSDFTNLFAGKKSNDIVLYLDDNQIVYDEFLGARVTWKNEVQVDHTEKGPLNNRQIKRTFVLRIKKKDKRRVLRSYIQHIHTVSDEIEQNTRRERRLFLNTGYGHDQNGRWRSVPWTHPSTMETVTMDLDLKNKVKSDLESFCRSKQYYHKLGRAWRRSYLLYGPSGTGKSSFISAVANFLSYDVYSLDLFRVADDSELTMLMLQTTTRSVVVIEDLDNLNRFLKERSTGVSLSGVMNFMDGIVSSCCGDERVFIFTANNKEMIDTVLLRPGRIDVHIHFPMCDFISFKNLASSYLGLKDHKLFSQVEEAFAAGTAAMSAAEISEIMIANRGSPSRALKTVITAMQTSADVAAAAKAGMRLSHQSSSSSRQQSVTAASTTEEENGGESGRLFKDGIPPMKELRKLYGLLRLKSTNKIGPLDHDSTTEISR